MRPLIFLATRTFVNGIKRALGSANRLIGLIFIGGYWLWYLFNPAFGSARPMSFSRTGAPFHFDFPIAVVLDGLFFASFALLSLPLLTMIANYNRVMRPADVDVLFPTPVSPKVVMGFRIVRDYLGTLLLPFFFLLFSRRYIPIQEFTGALDKPDAGSLLGRSWTLAWLLLALTWTAIGYAATLFINRSDLASTRNKRILDWSISGITILSLGFVALMLRQELSWASAVRIVESPLLRIIYFPATLAAAVALGPVANVGLSITAALALVAISVGFFKLAASQVGWMYDQAAVKGFENQESIALRKSGDMSGLIAMQARAGKIKAGRKGWLHKLKLKGAWAMLWREFIVQRRSARGGLLVLSLVSLLYSVLPIIITASLSERRMHDATTGYMILLFQCLGVFMGAMTQAQTGFLEFMRRVDLLKPLPFTSLTLVVSEIFGKSLIPILVSWTGSLVALAIKPQLWSYLFSSAVFVPSLAGLLTAATLVILLLFPEIDDPTQRSFRGLMSLLAIVLANLPGVLALIGLTFLTKQILIGAVAAVGVNALMIVGLGYLAGNLYMNFNPNE
jgi:uncharacterized membrane protein YhaH (DUF805 family)